MKRPNCLIIIFLIIAVTLFSGCYKAAPGASNGATSPGAPATVRYGTSAQSGSVMPAATASATPTEIIELDAIVGKVNADGSIYALYIPNNDEYKSVYFFYGYKPESFLAKPGQNVKIKIRPVGDHKYAYISVPDNYSVEGMTLISEGIPVQYFGSKPYNFDFPAPTDPSFAPAPTPVNGYVNVIRNVTITTVAGLKAYYESNNLDSALSSNSTFMDLMNNRYNEAFFETRFLVVLNLLEGNAGITHAAINISDDGVITIRAAALGASWPAMMAGFHMILELPRDTYPVKEYRIDYLAN